LLIKILGNGGALNDGLPFNSFLIDNAILIETPPDILQSLSNNSIDISSISNIYISHIHADHSFGFPLLALHLYFYDLTHQIDKKYNLFASKSVIDQLLFLVKIAVSEIHPLNNWIHENINFINVDQLDLYKINNYELKPYLMNHYEETYGFTISRNNEILLTYISDTNISDNIISLICNNSKATIIDLNGEINDPVKIHLSENDLLTVS
jgi:ribonuclease BN (tRNA processing enzyme)